MDGVWWWLPWLALALALGLMWMAWRALQAGRGAQDAAWQQTLQAQN